MMVDDLERWVQAYVRAWDSNDPEDVAALFTDDARYYSLPTRPAIEGRDAIVTDWLARRDEPGDYQFRYEILAASDDLGFVRGWTTYVGPPVEQYHNLWVLRLDAEGRAKEFTEWWMLSEPTTSQA